MDKTYQRNKRSVPIRFNQQQAYKYQSNTDKTNKFVNKNKQINQVNDSQQKYDNQSSQQYIQSSYMEADQDQQKNNKDQNQSYHSRNNYSQDLELEKHYKKQLKNQMKSSNNPYQLTFKKQLPHENEQFSYQEDYYNEYDQSNQQISSKHDFQDDSQSFEQVNYNQQNKSQNKINEPNNPESLIQIHDKLYQKYHSALVNYHYFHAKSSKTIQQKHKQHLLSLLVNQLQKNIFITGLKLTFSIEKRKRKQFMKAKQSIKPQTKQIFQFDKENSKSKQHQLDESFLKDIQPKIIIFQHITYGLVKRRLFECFCLLLSKSQIIIRKQSDEQFSKNYQNQQFSHLEDNHAEKIQSERPMDTNKILKKQKQQSPYNKYQVSESRQSQPNRNSSQSNKSKSKQQSSKSHQNQYSNHLSEIQNSDEEQNQNSEDEYENEQNEQQEPEQLQKMRDLIDYIEKLKKQGRQTDSQLRRYFLKWKIYLLEQILEDYQNQFNQNDQNQFNEGEHSQNQDLNNQNIQNEEDLQENYDMKTQRSKNQPINIYHHHQHVQTPIESLTQRQHSSHTSNKLKNKRMNDKKQTEYIQKSVQKFDEQDLIRQKKMILKSYLHEKYANNFIDCFQQNFTNKKLIIASKSLRQQNLKKNVLFGLQLNIEWRDKQRAMNEYYQQIAQQQDQTQYRTVELFYRTNLKARIFFEFVKTCKNLKWMKIFDNLILKLSFYKIKNFNEFKKRKQNSIQRYFIVRKTKILFKSFQTWKQCTVLSPNYQKLKVFNQKRGNQTVAQYFSVLQLLYKQSLIKQRKAINYYKMKQISKVYEYLKFLSQQARDLSLKQRQLNEYLMFSHGKMFYDSFFQFYGQRILEHRLNIKAQKLLYMRRKDMIHQRLQGWRNFMIKKQSYKAIEYRLVKLREKQIKQNILGIWIQQFDKRQNKKDELDQSAQHKDWLVKYYGNLCEIAMDGKYNN